MLKVTYILFISHVLALMLPCMVQGQKADVSKADKWYKERAYTSAIPIYEIAVREKFRIGIAQKLAQCYSLTNDWTKAAALLDTLVHMDKVRENMWFLYGEALMSNARYEEARTWFLKYAAAVPEDSIALQRADACLIIDRIAPLFASARYRALPFNSEADEHAAVPWNGGLVFTTDRSPGIKLLQEKSKWTGRHYLSLFYTEPLSDSTWTIPQPWTSRINEMNINVGYAVFSADSNAVYFTRNVQEPNDRGLYPLQIYSAQRTGSDRWSHPEPVSFANTAHNMIHPAISPDGLLFVYASDRPSGVGGLDLWISRWNGKAWNKPDNMGPQVNSGVHEGFPFFSADGRLFFASKGHPGFGGYDIFVTSLLEDNTWTTPQNVGLPINSPMDDITFYLLPDGRGGYFSSTRNGGSDDLYQWWSE
jgi:hypothetical protein